MLSLDHDLIFWGWDSRKSHNFCPKLTFNGVTKALKAKPLHLKNVHILTFFPHPLNEDVVMCKYLYLF